MKIAHFVKNSIDFQRIIVYYLSLPGRKDGFLVEFRRNCRFPSLSDKKTRFSDIFTALSRFCEGYFEVLAG